MTVKELLSLLHGIPDDLPISDRLGSGWLDETSDYSHGPIWVGVVEGRVRIGRDCSCNLPDSYRTIIRGQLASPNTYLNIRDKGDSTVTDDKIKLQSRIFLAVDDLARQNVRLSMTPIVDDDYPQVRHDWESALSTVIDAMRVAGDWRVAREIATCTDMTQISNVNLSRCLRWHPKGLDSWSLSDWGVALAGEVGEMLNVVKKMNRARDGLIGNKAKDNDLPQQLRSEIADVFLYLDLFAQRACVVLETAVRQKFNETSKQLGFPERL